MNNDYINQDKQVNNNSGNRGLDKQGLGDNDVGNDGGHGPAIGQSPSGELKNPFDLSYVLHIINSISPQVLGSYFHSQGLLQHIDFALLAKNGEEKYSSEMIRLIKTLPPNYQEMLITDCYIICFFLHATKKHHSNEFYNKGHGKAESPYNFLVRYIYSIKQSNNFSFVTDDALAVSDEVMYILINFRQEFYHSYNLCSHLFDTGVKWSIYKYPYEFWEDITKGDLQNKLAKLQEAIKQDAGPELGALAEKTHLSEFDDKILLHFPLASSSNSEAAKILAPELLGLNFIIDNKATTIAISCPLLDDMDQLYQIFIAVIMEREETELSQDNQIFTLQILLNQLLLSDREIPIEPSGVVTEFYINKLSFLNLSFTVSELTFDLKHQASGIKKFKEKSRDRFLHPDELPRFFESLNNEHNYTIKDYIYVSLFTGARKSNVLEMKWEDINLERCEWLIPETKNGESLRIHLTEKVIEILQKRLAEFPDSKWVFEGVGKTGHLVEPKSAWKRILERAGIKDLRLHDLRRTLGSWQAATGANSYIIGRSLGHKNQQSTAIYARLTIDPVKESVEKATQAMLKYVK